MQEAVEKARNAYEDLSSVYEYFADEIDNFTGKKYPPKEILTFADSAVRAAKVEINGILKLFPSDVVQGIEAKIKEELTGPAASP